MRTGSGTGTAGGTEERHVAVLQTEREAAEEMGDKKEEAADTEEQKVELKVRSCLEVWVVETERMLGDFPSEAQAVTTQQEVLVWSHSQELLLEMLLT